MLFLISDEQFPLFLRSPRFARSSPLIRTHLDASSQALSFGHVKERRQAISSTT
jgi:hypothetical protein